LPNGYLEQAALRGPDEPTEWDLASARLNAVDLREWVCCNWQRVYVPEEVINAIGLARFT
jgi:hypothetical protein